MNAAIATSGGVTAYLLFGYLVVTFASYLVQGPANYASPFALISTISQYHASYRGCVLQEGQCSRRTGRNICGRL
jgi:hypothetical protein